MVGLQHTLPSPSVLTRHSSGWALLKIFSRWTLGIQRAEGLALSTVWIDSQWHFKHSSFSHVNMCHFEFSLQDQTDWALRSSQLHGYHWHSGMVWPSGWPDEVWRLSVSTSSTGPHHSQFFDRGFPSQSWLSHLTGQVGGQCRGEVFFDSVSMRVWLCNCKHQGGATFVQLVASKIQEMPCSVFTLPSAPDESRPSDELGEAISEQHPVCNIACLQIFLCAIWDRFCRLRLWLIWLLECVSFIDSAMKLWGWSFRLTHYYI